MNNSTTLIKVKEFNDYLNSLSEADKIAIILNEEGNETVDEMIDSLNVQYGNNILFFSKNDYLNKQSDKL